MGMIQWDALPWFAGVSLLAAVAGVGLALWRGSDSDVAVRQRWVYVAMGMSVLVFSVFVAGMWLSLERPPMRTMGETRLWYSLFLLVIGWMTWVRTRYGAVLALSVLMSGVFMVINIAKPEIHQKELMAVLDSPWFVPHVVVYMFAYALIGCAAVVAGVEWFRHRWKSEQALMHCDRLIYQGMALLTMGMVMGALWAKQAWGDYWSWDPKEVWAAATWLAGLGYVHMRLQRGVSSKVLYGWVLVLFVLFQICWYGVNYLPSAQNSVHTYSRME